MIEIAFNVVIVSLFAFTVAKSVNLFQKLVETRKRQQRVRLLYEFDPSQWGVK